MSQETQPPIFKKQLLGEILIERKIISPEQLKQALDVQKKGKDYLGKVLVDLGFVEEIEIVIALVVQCNLPYIAIDRYEIEPKILQMVPENLAREKRLIPLDRVGSILSVVMVDPLDLGTRKKLERLVNCRVAPFIATRAQIERTLERCYREEKAKGKPVNEDSDVDV